MKDNLNIEELFQDKFNSFEGDVSPDAWANIQQGMNAAGAASTGATTGMSLLMKGVIAGGIVAATVTSIYLISNLNDEEIAPIDDNVAVNEPSQNDNIEENTFDGTPVLTENNISESVTNVDNQVNDTDAAIETEINPLNVVAANSEDQHSNNTDENNNGSEASNGSSEAGTANNENENNEDVSPINDPSPGTIDREPIVRPSIVSNPTAVADNEYAPSTYTFTANSENARRIEWLFEDGTVKTGEVVEFTFDTPGTYNVTMTVYGEGQVDQEVINVTVKGTSSIDTLPNIFTPTVIDRQNDFFAIAMTDIETFEIIIMDSNGVIVFESKDVNFRWYGLNQAGDQCPQGDYYYTFFAKGKDGVTHRKSGNKLSLK